MKRETQPRQFTVLQVPADPRARIEGDNRGAVVMCIKGSCWITQQGDLKDYFIESGDYFTISHWGLVMIQALQETKIILTQVESVCSQSHI